MRRKPRADAAAAREVDALLAKCSEAGVRPSAARLIVLQLLCTQHGLKTADEIQAAAQARGLTPPISGVYRALKDLERAGVVIRREFGKGRARFGLKTHVDGILLVTPNDMRAIALTDTRIDDQLRALVSSLGYDLVEREITVVVAEKPEIAPPSHLHRTKR